MCARGCLFIRVQNARHLQPGAIAREAHPLENTVEDRADLAVLSGDHFTTQLSFHWLVRSCGVLTLVSPIFWRPVRASQLYLGLAGQGSGPASWSLSSADHMGHKPNSLVAVVLWFSSPAVERFRLARHQARTSRAPPECGERLLRRSPPARASVAGPCVGRQSHVAEVRRIW